MANSWLRGTFYTLILIASFQPILAQKTVQTGILDLKSNPIRDSVLELNGDWEFYWKEFLPPEEFPMRLESNEPVSEFWEVPKIWNEYNNPKSGQGYASYRLTIESPYPIHAGLKIPDLATAYRIYWNGRLIGSAGVLGKDKETHKPQYYLSLESVDILEGKNELLVHVSNFSHSKGGIWETFQLGRWNQIRDSYFTAIASELFLAGAILIMGIYHLGLYMLRKKEKTALYFSLFCLFITVRILTVGERFLLILFPDIPWALGMNLEYNAYYFPPICFLMFINSVYPGYLHRYLIRGFLLMTLLFSSFLIIFPATIYPIINTNFHFVTISIILCGIYSVVRALIDKREGSLIFILGLIPIVIATVNDILFSMLIVQTFQMISIGLFIFIFSQSFILSMRLSRAFRDAETYSGQMKSLDKMKDDFLANTSNEIRSPLNGMIGIAESMLEGAAGKLTEDQNKNLSLIVSSGSRLSSLVNDLLDFSKIKNNDISLNFKSIDLQSILHVILITTKPLYKSKGLNVQCKYPENMPMVLGDEDRVQQILYNLIGNAIKFTQEGSILIHLESIGSQAKITIEDTGIGIPPDKLDSIFLSFEEMESTSKRNFRGAGLGLAISKKLIELQNGEIGVQSVQGEGSKFFFTLPLVQEATLLIPDSQSSLGENIQTQILKYSKSNNVLSDSGKSLNGNEIPENKKTTNQSPIHENSSFEILVVDDELINRQVLCNQLSMENYTIREAGSGREALTMIERGMLPDLVILDVMMPIMNGYEVCLKIRETYNLQDLPVLLITTKNKIQDIVIGLEAGANDYLSKPFDKRELLTRVKNLLTLKKAVQEQTKYLSFQNEMRIAQSLQTSILPEKPPEVAGLHFAYDYTPMEQVGGDFFDFHVFDENRIGVIIADVSGHGVPAALVASMFKIACSIQLEKASTPGELLSNINKTLFGKTKKAFITASYIEFWVKERKLLHARAGHPPMLFLDKNSEESYQSTPKGMMIGWFENASYQVEDLPLYGAKRVALYTDGIIEARNPKGELYSTERFIEILKKTKTWETDKAMAFIKEDIFLWSETTELEDDLTLILIDIDF